MVHSSVIQGQNGKWERGRVRRNARKPKIKEWRRDPLLSQSAVSVERLRGGIDPAIIVLQLTLSGEFCKFGSFTYPKTGSPVNRIKGKVLTQKATAPFSIPEQPAFFDDWNIIPIARPNRKLDTTLL